MQDTDTYEINKEKAYGRRGKAEIRLTSSLYDYSLFPRSQIFKKIGHGKLNFFKVAIVKLLRDVNIGRQKTKAKAKKTGTLCGTA